MPKYNGHRNWNHWNVSLWINNDEGLYRLAQECIKRFPGNRDQAAREFLGVMQCSTIPGRVLVNDPLTPDGALYSVTAIRAAMRGM